MGWDEKLDEHIVLNIGGAVAVRLIDARPADVRAVRRQLGTLTPEVEEGSADVEIRFVADPIGGEATLIGKDDAARAGDEFLLMRGRHRFAFALGADGAIRIRARHDSGEIPLLVPLLSAAAADRGLIPLHASAFVWKGRSVLLSGWSKGGKTEALLPFMERGAAFVGDEWLFMAPDEPVVSGIPEPIRIWDWHLEDLPALTGRLTGRERTRLTGWRTAAGLFRRLGRASSILTRVADQADKQRYVQIDPARGFGADRYVPRTPVDVVFLLQSSTAPGVRVAAADPATVARRIAASTTFEHLRVLEAELKQQYGFPERAHRLWEAVEARTAELESRLAGLPVFEVTHPYPVPTGDLFDAMVPFVEGAGA